MTYQMEQWGNVESEIKVLCVDHYKEIALDQDTIPLDPDWNRYRTACEAGTMFVVTARVDGEMIGYSIWLVSQHLHYKSTRWAYNDVIYLKPEYRGKGAGLGLITSSEKFMKGLGVKKIQWHVKVTNDWTPILERMGYAKEDLVMGKTV